MVLSSDTGNVEGQLKITGGHPRSNGLSVCMDLQLGGWSHFLMPAFLVLKVSSRSSGVAHGQLVYHGCVGMNLGGSNPL